MINQLAHFFAGGFLLMALVVLDVPYWIALLSVLGVVAIKEFLIEYLITHNDPTLWHATKDFLGWLAGMATASVILWVG